MKGAPRGIPSLAVAAAFAFLSSLALRLVDAPSAFFYLLGVVITIAAIYQTFAPTLSIPKWMLPRSRGLPRVQETVQYEWLAELHEIGGYSKDRALILLIRILLIVTIFGWIVLGTALGLVVALGLVSFDVLSTPQAIAVFGSFFTFGVLEQLWAWRHRKGMGERTRRRNTPH